MIGIYPGSFDPLTVGHMDIIQRASKLANKLIIAVGTNYEKKPFFSAIERQDFIEQGLIEFNITNAKVMVFEGLLVEFARAQKANFIVRGLRALSDFDFEFNLASSNKVLAPEIESIFLMTSVNKQFVSSRGVKEIFLLGGDIKPFVPSFVFNKMQQIKKDNKH